MFKAVKPAPVTYRKLTIEAAAVDQLVGASRVRKSRIVAIPIA